MYTKCIRMPAYIGWPRGGSRGGANGTIKNFCRGEGGSRGGANGTIKIFAEWGGPAGERMAL